MNLNTISLPTKARPINKKMVQNKKTYFDQICADCRGLHINFIPLFHDLGVHDVGAVVAFYVKLVFEL